MTAAVTLNLLAGLVSTCMNPPYSVQVDEICDAAERQWLNGNEPNLRELVDSAPAEIRVLLVQQLVMLDCEYRRKRDGQAPALEVYASQLGVDHDILQAVADTDLNAGSKNDTATILGPIDGTEGDAEDAQTAVPQKSKSESLKTIRIRGYEILSELGRGGMGVVYKALQKKPGRLVALKTIHSPHLAGEELLRRFQSEAEAAGRMDHPGIVPVYEMGEDGGVHFFSMGFVEGADLERKAREQILACREAAQICRDVAEALEYAHQKGVIHRDIKPQNILIDAAGRPRVTDFGLAKLTNQNTELTGSGQIMGTAAYMPPEQATGKTADAGPPADVYALGATLYRCMTGRPPFQAATAMEILRQVVEDEPVPPRRLNREIDADLQTICLKCLEKSPSRRFGTAREMADELNRYLRGEPIVSRPVGFLQSVQRWCWRRPYVAASLGLAVTLGLSLAIGVPYLVWTQGKLQLAEAERQNQSLRIQQQEEQVDRANELATTQEYFATVRAVSEKMAKPTPGWTWEALEQLQTAASLPVTVKDPAELRSMIAGTLCSVDLHEIARIKRSQSCGFITVSPDDRFVAVGDSAGVPTTTMSVYEVLPNTDSGGGLSATPYRTTSLFTFGDKARSAVSEITSMFGGGGKTLREGFRAGAFSPDGRHFVAGTRNGLVVCWDLGPDDPIKDFEVRPPEMPQGGMDHLRYSLDGTRIYVNTDKLREIQSLWELDTTTGNVIGQMRNSCGDFDVLSDGSLIVSHNDHLLHIQKGHSSEPRRLERPEGSSLRHLSALREESACIVRFEEHAEMLHCASGERGVSLEFSGKQVSKLMNVGKTGVIAGTTSAPDQLNLWDSLSGRRMQIERLLGVGSVNSCCSHSESQIHLGAEQDVISYEVRGSTLVEPVSIDSDASRGHGTSSVDRWLKGEPTPMESYVWGVAPIQSMDLSADGRQLAVLEQFADADPRKSRVRRIDAATGQETARWTTGIFTDWQPGLTAADVTFAGQAERIWAAAVFPGALTVLDDSGFTMLDSQGVDSQEFPVTTITSQQANWVIPPIQDAAGCRMFVAFHSPRGLKPSEELRFTLRTNGRDFHRQIPGKDLDAAGWYLTGIWGLLPEEMSFESSLTVSLEGTELEWLQPETEASSSALVRASSVWLLIGDAGNPTEDRFLGPVCARPDGGVAAVVGKEWLYQWSSDLQPAAGPPWQDLVNNREDLLAVAGSGDGVIVGSKSGLVVRLPFLGKRFLLQDGEKAPEDGKESVSSAAATPDGHWAAVGTLGGQIKLYDLAAQRHQPESVTPGHALEVSALAFTQDGMRLASGCKDGSVRIWDRSLDTLTMWLELAVNPNEVLRLRFSADNRYLYILHRNERGIRRLDLHRLAGVYSRLSL